MKPVETDIEYRSSEEIKVFQEQLLQKAMRYLAKHSAYYRRMFERYEIHLDQIRHIEDLVKIPFRKRICNSSTRSSCAVPGSRSSIMSPPRELWVNRLPSAARRRICSVWPTTRRNPSPAQASVRGTSYS